MQELSHAQFLGLLKQRGIEISVREGRLKVSAPTGAVDPALHAELTRRKSELLALIQVPEAPSRPRALVPMERNGRIPQTHAQQGMWLIEHFNPGNVAYNIPEAFRVAGPCKLETLQTAVDRLLARHETLRTYFYEEDGELLQAVSDDAKTIVGFTDLSKIADSEREKALSILVREKGREPFDLSRAPMVRFHLFRLAEDRHVIFFNIHHIIADRRSLVVVQHELNLLYQSATGNETIRLPELPVQYGDYALWAERFLADGAMASQIAYWKTKLAGAPPYLELPCSRPYPEDRTPWGAAVLVSIPSPVQKALSEIAREEGATMFMTLLAAFAVLLYKHSGVEDFCIGSPFTHRNQVETAPLIGLFVNMLAFRCQLDREPSFREMLRRVRTTALEAYEHSDVPFQELVRALKPDLRSRRSPVFQIMFGFDSDIRPGQDTFIPVDTNPGTAKFDLTLQLREGPDGISGWFEYCTDLFDSASIDGLAKQFIAVMTEIGQQPDEPLRTLVFSEGAVAEVVGAEAVVVPDAEPGRSTFWSGGIKKLTRRLVHRINN